MNLEAAHAFCLASYGNFALSRKSVPLSLLEDHPVFAPLAKTQFRLEENLIAQSPAEFFQRLIADEVASCSFIPISMDRPVRPYRSAMYLGGGNWGLETAWDQSHLIWIPQWDADENHTPMVSYQGLPVEDRPLPKPILEPSLESLKLSITGFLEVFPEYYEAVRVRLASAISTASEPDQFTILLPPNGYAGHVHAAVNVCGQAFIFDSQTRLPDLIEPLPNADEVADSADKLLEAILTTLTAASTAFTLVNMPDSSK